MRKYEFTLWINDTNCGTFIYKGLNESEALRYAAEEIQAVLENLPVDVEFYIDVA